MKIKILFICLLASTLFNGCKKDEEPTTTPPPSTPTAKTDLLCGENWMLTAYTVSPAFDFYGTGNPISNLMGTMQPCALNNLTVYSTNLSYLIDEGPTKCSSSASQTFETGTWAFNTGETHLLVTRTGAAAIDYTFVTLNATTLQYSQSIVVGATTYVHLKTFTKQ